MAHGSRRDGVIDDRWLRASASHSRPLGGDGRGRGWFRFGALASLAGALLAVPQVYAGPTFNPGNLVLDPSSLATNSLFPDTVGASAVFTRYGQNPWFGSFSYDTGTQFLGLDTGNLGDSVGGITSACTPDIGFGSACSYFGAKVSASGRARAGVEYSFMTQGGSLDVRYPVKVTLDLPYGPGGTNVPRVGEAFTIGSSWSLQNPKTLGKPGTPPGTLEPLLATHGPTLEAFVDLVGALRANIDAELCAVVCTGDPFPGFDKAGAWELAAINRNGDGQVRVFGQTASSGSPGELMGGVLKYYLNAPTLDAKGTLGADGKTLTATAGDKLVGLGLGIDELVATLLGLPPLSDSFGISIGGKHLGVGYNVFDATAWLDLLLKQKLGFVGSPTVELEFSGKVRVRNASGAFGPPTYKVSFKAGESIELLVVDAQLVGVVPTVRLFGQVSNETDLELAGSVSVSALGLDTPLGDIGPLFPTQTTGFPVGSTSIFDQTFPMGFGDIVGGEFNMAFLPPLEATTMGPNSVVLTFWDKGQWGAAGTGCASLADCSFLPQSKVIGFYDLVDGDPVLGCLQRAGNCDPEALVRLLDFDRFHDRFFASSPRLFGADDYEVFLGDLLALNDPLLNVQAGLTPEEIERSRDALRLAFGPQPFIVPPAPVPEPGSLALIAIALAGTLLARRRVAAVRPQASSRRTIAAPAASAASLPNAISRGKYFMPQSGAGMRRSALT